MNINLSKAKDILQKTGCGLAVVKDGETLTFDEPGVKTLLSLQGSLTGAFVADRIVGKAAALLLARGGAVEVYARIISEPALKVFEKYRVACVYGEVVENIQNRVRSGICPMESAVFDTDECDEAYKILLEKTGFKA